MNTIGMGNTSQSTAPGVGRAVLRGRDVVAFPAASSASRAIGVLAAGAAVGMLVSGFWNVRAVDGLGLAMFVTPVIGAFEKKSAEFATHGPAFGLLFGVLAGLAATFTASNLAGFAMVPVLLAANARARKRLSLLRLQMTVAGSAAVVGLALGVLYGRMGPEGAAAFNVGPIRSAQSFTVFGALGLLLLAWAAIEAGLASPVTRRIAPVTRAAWRQPAVVALCVGAVIGLFSVGRPLAVFREALLYAAQPADTLYAAVTVALAVLATTGGVSLVMTLVAWAGEPRVTAWMRRRPQQARLLAAGALAAGGSFLAFYWAIARVWPAMGKWGFRLGWYA